MFPYLEIYAREQLVANRYIDRLRNYLTIGTSALNDITTLEDNEIKRLKALRFNGKYLLVTLSKEMNLTVDIADKELNLDSMAMVGMAKNRGALTLVKIKVSKETTAVLSFAEFSIQISFREKPRQAEEIRLPLPIYIRGTLKHLDWRFGSVSLLCIVMWFLSGKFLYGLPLPVAPFTSKTKARTHITTIFIPQEALLPPVRTAIGPRSKAQTSAKKTTAQVFNRRLVALLGRNANTNELDLGNQRIQPGAGGNKLKSGRQGNQIRRTGPLRVGTAGNYQVKPGLFSKQLAAISPQPFSQGARRRRFTTLNRTSIESILRRHYDQLQNCYEELLRIDKSRSGKIYMNFEVNTVGKAIGINIVGPNSLLHPAFRRCLSKVVTSIQFPAPKASVPIKYPLLFSPRTL